MCGWSAMMALRSAVASRLVRCIPRITSPNRRPSASSSSPSSSPSPPGSSWDEFVSSLASSSLEESPPVGNLGSASVLRVATSAGMSWSASKMEKASSRKGSSVTSSFRRRFMASLEVRASRSMSAINSSLRSSTPRAALDNPAPTPASSSASSSSSSSSSSSVDSESDSLESSSPLHSYTPSSPSRPLEHSPSSSESSLEADESPKSSSPPRSEPPRDVPAMASSVDAKDFSLSAGADP
mmetsp:Transcript_32708/g.73839  ORF Transcript_32708/g.73839 Transcript_32708/m.73839 type:complete len:240 (-) Transcript_32708:21-740(-)